MVPTPVRHSWKSAIETFGCFYKLKRHILNFSSSRVEVHPCMLVNYSESCGYDADGAEDEEHKVIKATLLVLNSNYNVLTFARYVDFDISLKRKKRSGLFEYGYEYVPERASATFRDYFKTRFEYSTWATETYESTGALYLLQMINHFKEEKTKHYCEFDEIFDGDYINITDSHFYVRWTPSCEEYSYGHSDCEKRCQFDYLFDEYIEIRFKEEIPIIVPVKNKELEYSFNNGFYTNNRGKRPTRLEIEYENVSVKHKLDEISCIHIGKNIYDENVAVIAFDNGDLIKTILKKQDTEEENN